MSEVKHWVRLHQDDNGLTHWVSWDDYIQIWFHICDVGRNVPGKPSDDHDSRHGVVTCFRCMNRYGFFTREHVGAAVFNTKALSKIDFNPE